MEKPRFGNDPIAEYVRANPEHSVTVCMNVQYGDDKRLRYTFEQRRGPYRPQTLGVYVEDSLEAALKKLQFSEAEKAKAKEAKTTPSPAPASEEDPRG